MRGVPKAKTDACLADQARGDQARPDEQRRGVATINIPGTPTFVINGETVVENTASWAALEPKIKAALGWLRCARGGRSGCASGG